MKVKINERIEDRENSVSRDINQKLVCQKLASKQDPKSGNVSSRLRIYVKTKLVKLNEHEKFVRRSWDGKIATGFCFAD